MVNKMKQQLKPNAPEESAGHAPLNNQDGSVIVMVLMILAIMTVIGIVSSNTVITENFMVRNVGIRKQNVNLVESALMQGLQQFMQLNTGNPNNFDPTLNIWINDRTITTAGAPEELINTIWYENTFTQPCLDVNNSLAANTLPLLATRGEKRQRHFALCGRWVAASQPWNQRRQHQRCGGATHMERGPDSCRVCVHGWGWRRQWIRPDPPGTWGQAAVELSRYPKPVHARKSRRAAVTQQIFERQDRYETI